MKNAIIRIIGVFAIAIGIVTPYNGIVGVISSPSVLSIYMIGNVVLSLIALYGGYQTVKLKPIGRKLLVIFFSYQAVLTIIFVFIIVWSISGGSFNVALVQKESIVFRSIYYLLCTISLMLLLWKNIISNFQRENNHDHTAIIGKILSFVAPGLGRALVGNNWAGVILFAIYFSLFGGFRLTDLVMTGAEIAADTFWYLFINLGTKLLIWASFFKIDWTFVNNAVKLQEVVAKPTEAISSAQSGG